MPSYSNYHWVHILPVAGISIPWFGFQVSINNIPGFLLSLQCAKDVIQAYREDRDFRNQLFIVGLVDETVTRTSTYTACKTGHFLDRLNVGKMTFYRWRWEEGTMNTEQTEIIQCTHRGSVPIQLFIKETVIFVKQSFLLFYVRL
jgi:hypothetical protein